MSQIIKTFLGIYLILFMAVTSVGILAAYMQVLGAQDLQARIVDELENSRYAAPVIRAEFEEANRAGCRLTVTLYYENGRTIAAESASRIPDSTQEVCMARVELSFPFQVACLGIRQEHTLTGYAR